MKKPIGFNVFKTEVFNTAIDEALETSCVNGGNREPCYAAALTKELPRILNGIINGATKWHSHLQFRVVSTEEGVKQEVSCIREWWRKHATHIVHKMGETQD